MVSYTPNLTVVKKGDYPLGKIFRTTRRDGYRFKPYEDGKYLGAGDLRAIADHLDALNS